MHACTHARTPALIRASSSYKGVTNPCTTKGIKTAASITGYVALPTNNYTALINAIQLQPISISVAATKWSLYSGGIFSSECGADVNHAVQLVGASLLPLGCLHQNGICIRGNYMPADVVLVLRVLDFPTCRRSFLHAAPSWHHP
jgi:hypothetical protein